MQEKLKCIIVAKRIENGKLELFKGKNTKEETQEYVNKMHVDPKKYEITLFDEPDGLMYELAAIAIKVNKTTLSDIKSSLKDIERSIESLQDEVRIASNELEEYYKGEKDDE